MISAAANLSCLCVAGLSLAVIIDGIDVSDYDVVHLLDCVLNLKFVGISVYDEAITVQLFALSRQLLCYDWLNNDSHLRVRLAHVSLGEDVLNTVNHYQCVGIHNGVGVDFVN